MKNSALVVGMLLVSASTGIAGTSTSNMNVSATVTTSCSISAGSLAFGSYDAVTGAAVQGTAALSVACTKGATAQITLGQGSQAGTGSSDIAPLRRMKDSGTNYLSYSLFQDSARTTVWGNTSVTGASYLSAGSAATTITVYGTIGATQDVPAGSYTDSVVATVTF